jgi:hypothetical protein
LLDPFTFKKKLGCIKAKKYFKIKTYTPSAGVVEQADAPDSKAFWGFSPNPLISHNYLLLLNICSSCVSVVSCFFCIFSFRLLENCWTHLTLNSSVLILEVICMGQHNPKIPVEPVCNRSRPSLDHKALLPCLLHFQEHFGH